jgi:HPt (histidine-containing phosphotransfer) domain-containing protein
MPEVIGARNGTLNDDTAETVDWVLFEKNRAELGPSFIRILTYFREDGAKSVLPAHTIKGESRQLGAEPLAKIAELIESTARLCVETHRFPDELVPEVVQLRGLFAKTVELFDRATNPLMTRAAPSGFGRKINNQNFGRL